jgi:hypothetical protein
MTLDSTIESGSGVPLLIPSTDLCMTRGIRALAVGVVRLSTSSHIGKRNEERE